MTPSTPKTYIHMAREAPVGVVLYRRSHLTTYVLLLKSKKAMSGTTYRLITGSRFYGRIFPERCDVSPEGKLFIYFAMRGRKTNGKSDPTTWTAISEPPSLRALVFCPNGSTWGGGGAFLLNRRLVLFDDVPSSSMVRDYQVLPDLAHVTGEELNFVHMVGGKQKSVTLKRPITDRRGRQPYLERHRKLYVASGYDMYDYVLKNSDGTDVEGAEDIVLANWAGWDCDGRLLVAAGRHVHIYDVTPGRALGKPKKTLDLEAVIASKTRQQGS